MKQKDRTSAPVFFDESGKRWKRTKAMLFIATLLAIYAVTYSIPHILQSEPVTKYQEKTSTHPVPRAHPSPEQLAATLSSLNTPIIGTGSLVRVSQIQNLHGQKIVAPLYGASSRPLTAEEDSTIGQHEYVIEQFGHVGKKRLAFTFDDGPDAVYTPQILDLLSKEAVPSTFFMIGSNVAKYPAIVERAAREGHVLANHTLSHTNFDFLGRTRALQEINLNQRLIRAASGQQTAFFRPPYIGNDPQSLRNAVASILYAQSLGYTTVGFTFDTNDWEFTIGQKQVFPDFNGDDIVALVHDGGGDRSKTVAYLQEFITKARSHGYSFVELNQLYPQNIPLSGPVTVSLADRMTMAVAKSVYVWPHEIVRNLFFTTVGIVFIGAIFNTALAIIQQHRAKRFKSRKAHYQPKVSVIIPSYNEGKVIEKAVGHLLKSYYKNIEIIVIDDGSTDDTLAIARKIMRRTDRLRVLHQSNHGKSAAGNFGIKKADGEIIVAIDADTIVSPRTIGKLVRHFSDESIGAVAGNVKVGNITNLLTRWQALDYLIGIHIERSAQALLNSILVVPGACGAWRKTALVAAGGYSHNTLSEDCDVTLAVHRAGYRVVQDNTAMTYTEAPTTLGSLSKQRFRWIFGNIQSYWKHRDMLFRRRYGWLGFFVLPNAIISIVLPLVFGPILFVVAVGNILDGNVEVLLLFFAITFVIQFSFALIAIILAHERLSHILALPITRFVYLPLRSYLLYRSVLTAFRGAYVGWNKLNRTGSVKSLPIVAHKTGT